MASFAYGPCVGPCGDLFVALTECNGRPPGAASCQWALEQASDAMLGDVWGQYFSTFVQALDGMRSAERFFCTSLDKTGDGPGGPVGNPELSRCLRTAVLLAALIVGGATAAAAAGASFGAWGASAVRDAAWLRTQLANASASAARRIGVGAGLGGLVGGGVGGAMVLDCYRRFGLHVPEVPLPPLEG